MSIIEKIGAYLGEGRRDTGYERQLLKELRKLSQEQRYVAVQPYLNKSRIALIFSQKASLSKAAYREIWRNGMEHSNASSIQEWVITVASNLGWSKTFSLIDFQIEVGNEKIEEAIYHVPYIFGKLAPSPKDKKKFICLVQKSINAGLLRFNPDSVWGSGWRA